MSDTMQDIIIEIKAIEEHYVKARLDEAYETLHQLCSKNPQCVKFDSAATSILSRFNDLNNSIMQGCMDHSQQENEKRNIRISFDLLIKQLKTQFQVEQTFCCDSNIVDMTQAAAKVLKQYLLWLIEQHSTLRLHGIREAGRLPSIPLEKVYMALRCDTTNIYERSQSRILWDIELQELLEKAENEGITLAELKILETKLAQQNPYMPSWERKRKQSNQSSSIITLGKAFQNERWLVILGAPGSGKTTLARWLILKLARSLKDELPDVMVPIHQVNPDVEKNDKMVNLGPVRLPVLVRVSDYAIAYSKAQKEGHPLPLADYLGHHPWANQMPMCDGDFIPPNAINALIKQFLRNGKAVVILDGLDELTKNRQDVVTEIESFIRIWINGHGQGMGLENTQVRLDKPVKVGGNQIVITSRIVGYQISPIHGELSHVLVEPMRPNAVKHFCHSWTQAVYKLLPQYNKAETEIRKQKAYVEAQGLIDAIYDDSRPKIHELASNPLLVTIIALVYRDKQGSLPQQRAELYGSAIQNLLSIWLERRDCQEAQLTAGELIFVLSPVAEYIHRNYANGLIREDELSEIVKQYIVRYRNPDMVQKNLPQRDADTIEKVFLTALKEDVGLLAEQGENIYAFMHLTFQEYLAARYLLHNKQKAADHIIERLDDPRWCEPILLALGYMSTDQQEWGPKARANLLQSLLNADDPLSDLLPRTALLITTALPEMANVPSSIITEVTNILLRAYADHKGLGQFESLREQIEKALNNLRDSEYGDIVDQVLENILKQTHAYQANLSPAIATLINDQGWFTPKIVKALLNRLHDDSALWNCPVDRALRRYIAFPLSEPTGIKGELEKLKKELQVLESNLQRDKQRIAVLKERIQRIPYFALRTLSEPTGIKDELEKLKKELQALESNLQGDKQRIAVLKECIPYLEKRLEETESQAYSYEEKCKTTYEAVATILPFRQALERNNKLVARITNNFDWMCLVVALYGGFDDYEIVKPLREIHKAWQQKGLGLSNEEELAENLKNAAEISHIATLAPKFSPLYIYRDSSLTSRILSALRRDEPTKNLMDYFWQVWKTANKVNERAEAMLALIVLGENIISVLEDARFDTTQQGIIETVLARLSCLAQALQDPVVRTKKQAIGAIPRDIPAQHQVDMLATTIETIIANGASSLEVIVRIPEKPSVAHDYHEQLVYQEAEGWAWYTSNADSDDFIYNLAVTLDTVGKSLFNPSVIESFAMAYAARNNQWDLHYNWPLEQLQPRYRNLEEAFISALVAFETIPKKLDFFRNHAIISTKPFLDEHSELLPEVLVLAVTHLDSYREVFQALAPDSVQNDPDPYWKVVNMVSAIKNPYYRFRALWRLGQNGNFLFKKEALQTIAMIDEPLHHVRALEQVLPYVGLEFVLSIRLLMLVEKIDDPENQARALGRLATLPIIEQRASLLKKAIETTREIENENRRAETLRELRPLLHLDSNSFQHVNTVADTFTDAWYQAKALGWRSAHFFEHKDKLSANIEIWVPITLATLVADIQSYFSSHDDDTSLWTTLSNKPHERLVRQLREQGKGNGLKLSLIAASALNTLIKNNELKLAHDLLPLVEHPETTTITLIEGWLEHADPLIVSYAALLLAESGRLTPKIVPHLIDFLTGNEDRSRYRAAIVLYGKDYLFSTSGVDTETVDVLMQTQLDYKQDNPRVAIAITWFFEQLIHDSAEAIEIWINRLKEGKNVEVASKILSHINSITPTAWRAFVSGLNDSNHEVQKALLKSVCRLIYLNNRNVSGGFPDDAWQTLAEIIPQMDEEVLADCSTPPFEPSKIVEALSIALSNSNDDSVSDSEIIKSATTIHKNFSLRLSDAVGKTQEKLREQIFQIGKSYFISVDYWKNATDAALKVKEKPELLPLLLQWFLTTLDEDKNDIFVYYKTTDILSVLSYTAQYMPAAFASKTDPSLSILEKSLIDIVKYYNSFPARSSAMYLLSYLRWVTADVVQALTDANRDVSYVQQAAIEAVVQFRHIDGDILPVLFENLSSPSASLAYATVQMLTTIGLDEQTSSEQRKSILANLAEAIREPLSKREIYLLTSSFNNSTITYVGTLNQVFYKVLLQISGSV